MRSFTIGKNDADQRFDKFIAKTLPALPKSLLYKYLRTKRIKLNGKKADIAVRLREGDLVEMYISDEFFAEKEEKYSFLGSGRSRYILYEDDNIIVLNKKAGLLSHPDEGEYVDTLITRVQRYLYEKGEYRPDDEMCFAPALCNRIDRNTGGIVIAAKNAESLRILNQKIRDRELTKLYLCAVNGVPEKREDTLTAYLYKNEAENRVVISDKKTPENRTIVTKYRVLSVNSDGDSLLEVDLVTGRTHQIRAHMAYIGHPLLGDGKYGSNRVNKEKGYRYQALYSYKLRFEFTTDAGILSYLDGKEFTAENVWFAEKFGR